MCGGLIDLPGLRRDTEDRIGALRAVRIASEATEPVPRPFARLRAALQRLTSRRARETPLAQVGNAARETV
jgi:hypothetical protein